jgi:hypothetical protein
MRNYKAIFVLFIMCAAGYIYASEMYVSQSETSQSRGLSNKKPLTTTSKTEKKQKKVKRPSALTKEQQKEFREALAGYRGTYTLQQLLLATGGKEVKAEKRLREQQEATINQYGKEHPNDPYIANKLKRLEDFKNKEIPNRFKQLAEKKNIELKPELSNQIATQSTEGMNI